MRGASWRLPAGGAAARRAGGAALAGRRGATMAGRRGAAMAGLAAPGRAATAARVPARERVRARACRWPAGRLAGAAGRVSRIALATPKAVTAAAAVKAAMTAARITLVSRVAAEVITATHATMASARPIPLAPPLPQPHEAPGLHMSVLPPGTGRARQHPGAPRRLLPLGLAAAATVILPAGDIPLAPQRGIVGRPGRLAHDGRPA